MRFFRPLVALWAVLVCAGFLAAAPFPNGVASRLAAAASWPVPPAGVPDPGAAALPASWIALGRGAAWGALLAATAWTAGRMTAPWLRLPLLPAAAVPGAAGLVICGTGALGLGLAGLAFASVLRLGVLLLAPLGLAAAGVAVTRWRLHRLGTGGWAIAAGGAVAALWTLAAFNPEPGIDAYLYHLRLPFIYLLHHRVHHVWHHIHGQVPQVWELLLMAVPPRDAATAAQVLSALCVLPVVALTVAFGGGGGSAILAALLLVSSPLVVAIGTSAYTDLPLVWLGAASFALLVMPNASPSPPRRFAAGAVLGGACALKYAAFPLVVAMGVWLLAGSVRRREWRWAWPSAVGMLAVFLPWIGWNWLAAGNPVDPFLARWFPDSLPALPFAERLSGAVLRRPWRDVFASPWSAYVASEPFLFVSPWLVAAAPALLAAPAALRSLPGSGLWLAVCVAVWAALIADERFLLPAAPLVAGLLARAGWCRMPGAIAAGLLVLNLAGAVRQVFVPLPRLWTALGVVSRDAYLRGTLIPAPGYADAASWLNSHTAVKDRILVVSDCKSHLIWRECVTDHVYDYPTRLVWILWGTPGGAVRIAARFRQLGIRWVLYLPGRAGERLGNMPDLFEFRPGEAASWAAYWSTHARRAWSGPEAGIYGLDVRARAPAELPDLPAVQEVMAFSARLTLRREGPGALVTEVRRYAAAYPNVGAAHRLAGEVLVSLGGDSLTRAEGRRELETARRIEAAAGGER
ncbi:MAG: glycosyltransferase family 39 protein [Candidatus Coatesbacteria bacterium]